ncbi:MAG: hypothetical protein IKL87_06930 [Oscillospiraceae bacterium]|nr:hypothetical protein [Oscillospiraceae bacterium]
MNLFAVLNFRRIRIRSWKDLVIIGVAIVINIVVNQLLDKMFPMMSEKLKKVILFLITLIVCIVGLAVVAS